MSNLKDLDIEELESIISNEDTSDIEFATPSDGVMRYIKDFNLESGKHPISNFLVYYHYVHKFEPTSKKKISYIEFFRQFNKVFDQRRTGKTRYYMLTPGIYNLDKESIDVAKKFQEEIFKSKD